jgi:hypothetical protein
VLSSAVSKANVMQHHLLISHRTFSNLTVKDLIIKVGPFAKSDNWSPLPKKNLESLQSMTTNVADPSEKRPELIEIAAAQPAFHRSRLLFFYRSTCMGRLRSVAILCCQWPE